MFLGKKIACVTDKRLYNFNYNKYNIVLFRDVSLVLNYDMAKSIEGTFILALYTFYRGLLWHRFHIADHGCRHTAVVCIQNSHRREECFHRNFAPGTLVLSCRNTRPFYIGGVQLELLKPSIIYRCFSVYSIRILK